MVRQPEAEMLIIFKLLLEAQGIGHFATASQVRIQTLDGQGSFAQCL